MLGGVAKEAVAGKGEKERWVRGSCGYHTEAGVGRTART